MQYYNISTIMFYLNSQRRKCIVEARKGIGSRMLFRERTCN